MKKYILFCLVVALGAIAKAHTVKPPVTPEDLDTIRDKVSALSRVHLGGYGEAAFNYDFSGLRSADGDALYQDGKWHGSMNIPRVVLMLGVNLGKGWGVETDVQFENCKSVSIDQFWVEKLFSSAAGVRTGYLTLPVGATNAHDDPMEFFGVNRPVGEDEILPCDWHQPGISFFGEAGGWGYEAIVSPGKEPGVAWRGDNYLLAGTRLSLSGYYGWREHGCRLSFLSFDFLYDNCGWIVRGNGNWGHTVRRARMLDEEAGMSARHRQMKSAFSAGAEAGYDLLRLGRREHRSELYLFGRYEYWEPAEESADAFLGYDWTRRQKISVGLNFKPIERVVIKGEYSHCFLPGGGSVPMLSFGVGYSGQFF